MNRSTYRRHTWAARSLSRPPKRTWTTPLRRCSTSALKRPWPFNGPHPGSGAQTTGGPRESPLRTGPTGKLGTAHSLPPQGGGTAPAGPGKITPHTVLSPNTQPTAQHYQPGGQARSSTQPKSPTEAPSQGHPKKSLQRQPTGALHLAQPGQAKAWPKRGGTSAQVLKPRSKGPSDNRSNAPARPGYRTSQRRVARHPDHALTRATPPPPAEPWGPLLHYRPPRDTSRGFTRTSSGYGQPPGLPGSKVLVLIHGTAEARPREGESAAQCGHTPAHGAE